ncbi:PepSY-associated TM helix domain-containing protein [Sphaerisporangium sp. TRM90804]|uniref:PepSY-associated TM helix domain-containing protein n=1 Tax=Sphaerisporangium sp. TRM90804 TaxID=3031113 RepID=UPI002448DFAD|nr:PepSY-associated TM helix domain-containing protein [Sphaerisporangium sp. TRM90804]MDH2428067.1 PepSY-associated TM helix domain-containing protein [Sphaerisporangium sp. TRM90804]
MTSSVDVQPAAQAPEPPPARRGTWGALRPAVLRLHFYAGVLIAPFLLVAAFTGLLYAASFQVENVVYRHELTATAGGTALPLARQVAAARAAHPQGTVTAVRTPEEPGQTTRVLLAVPGLAESTQLAVFVDPATAQVRGSLESYGGSGALPVRAWISKLHRTLHLGEPGRVYSELAASWLWVVALGGLVLWLTRRRRTGGRLRGLFWPGRAAGGGLRRTLPRHGALGLWVAAGLLFLSATGLTWSKYAGENVGDLRTALGWSTPSVSAAGDHAAHSGGTHAPTGASADAAVDAVAGAAAAKGLAGPLEVVWPTEAGGAYVVKEIDKQWPIRGDQVAVGADGRVTDELRFADHPFAAKLTRFGIDAHMGLLFGLANQIALAAVALALITLVLYGYRMWWQRRPTRGFARPYERGALRGTHPGVVAVLAVVAAGVGVFLPVLGVSLAAFLLLDVLLGLRSRRAARPVS